LEIFLPSPASAERAGGEGEVLYDLTIANEGKGVAAFRRRYETVARL
jgi:hypothetical protein